jgi:hypothetical protein
LVLWLFERFDLSLSAAGLFSSGRARSAPSPFGRSLDLQTHRPRQHMVFTHIPASMF